jgi:hypothetical protein
MLKKSVEKKSPKKDVTPKSVGKKLPKKDVTPNWRTHDINFVKKSSNVTIEPGAVTFSAGWLGQGHEVGVLFYIIIIILKLI